MKVRPVTVQDIDALADMAREFEAHLGTLEGKPRKVSAERIKRDYKRAGIGTNQSVFGLLAADETGPLGFALYFFGFNGDVRRRTVFVSDFFVRRRARRQGVGRKLMQSLRKLALKHDCTRIDLAVWNLNPAALGFYLDLGFKPVDEELLLTWRLSR